MSSALRILVDDHFDAESLLVSQESWYRQANALKSFCVRVPVEVVMFVRPQVEWLSSAWWQWFAWTNKDGNPLHAWRVLQKEGALDWSRIAQIFADLPQVQKVTVRLFAPKTDVVENFLIAIDVRLPKDVRTSSFRRNSSLTTHHLALYKAMPWLRSSNAGSLDAVLTNL